MDLHKCGDQEGAAAPSGYFASDLLSALLNISCNGSGGGTVLFSENHACVLSNACWSTICTV